MNNKQIPQTVIDALATIRESGLTNMLARETVIALIMDGDDFEAADWLIENKPRFMEALMEMGKQVNIHE